MYGGVTSTGFFSIMLFSCSNNHMGLTHAMHSSSSITFSLLPRSGERSLLVSFPPFPLSLSKSRPVQTVLAPSGSLHWKYIFILVHSGPTARLISKSSWVYTPLFKSFDILLILLPSSPTYTWPLIMWPHFGGFVYFSYVSLLIRWVHSSLCEEFLSISTQTPHLLTLPLNPAYHGPPHVLHIYFLLIFSFP